MTITPSGRLDGTDLVVTRTFSAGVEDVWASVTEPERTARWYGTWEGEAAPGSTVKVQMAFEDGKPWTDMLIEVCEPPRRLVLFSTDEVGQWRIELRVRPVGDSTELSLVHHDAVDGAGDFGPGWEWYLDNLVAAREGTPQPSFDDYYPAMKGYYQGLAEKQA
ncbi:SRPBCC family protein [Actinoplanes sp. NPDC051861]|uniref:SRPBCC family protein n=1 Tax=Actinoplanes sp. NPDC051861 TaxID=3155170 RepID=UPI003449B622